MSYGELEASLVRENRELREQNRVLREALQEISTAVWKPGLEGVYDEDARYNYPDREQNIRRMAQAALTATSQEGQHGSR